MLKVSIIGAGNVGSTAALEIARLDIASEVVLLDIKEGLAEGKAIDISQSAHLLGFYTKVTGVTNDYSKTAMSDVVIITSGTPRKPGMTREELVTVNGNIVRSVLQSCAEYSPKAIYIIVSNPLDSMVYLANKVLNISSRRILGMGNLLDSCRFAYYISQETGFSVPQIDAVVIGGHGDTTMRPQMGIANARGVYIEDCLSSSDCNRIKEETMKGGATLTSLIGTSAWVTPAVCIAHMTKAILLDACEIIPCSVLVGDVAIGTLCVVGREGVLQIDDNLPKELEPVVVAIKKVNSVLDM